MGRQNLQAAGGDLGALNARIDIDVSSIDEVALFTAGTFVGTISFFVSDNGVDFVPIAGVDMASTARTTGVISATVAGKVFSFRTYPLKTLRVKMTAYTSGTATIRSTGYTVR
mgnify:CR=1 FL=1